MHRPRPASVKPDKLGSLGYCPGATQTGGSSAEAELNYPVCVSESALAQVKKIEDQTLLTGQPTTARSTHSGAHAYRKATAPFVAPLRAMSGVAARTYSTSTPVGATRTRM